jgi:hypothetical protein
MSIFTQDFQKRLVAYIESNYNSGSPLEGIELPPQGMSSSVVFVVIAISNCKAFVLILAK